MNKLVTLSELLRMLRTHHKHARKSTQIDGVFTLVNAVAALFMTILLPPGSALPSTIITWVMYRKYLHCRWRERLLLEALNHAQRIYVETPERADQHHNELTLAVAKLNLVQ